MAAVVKGTAHLYGIGGTVADATVLSFSEKLDTKNNAQTENESGNVIELRFDDITKEGQITIRQRTGWTKPAVGNTLTYNSIAYTVTSVDSSESNKGFRESVLAVRTSEAISLA